MRRPLPPEGRRSWRALLAALTFAVVLASGLAPVNPPTPVAAGTAETMEARILAWINNDRLARNLVPLRLHGALVNLSGDRAATMASKGSLSHTIAGCLSCQLSSRSIQWFGYGEAIGATSYAWGDQAAASLYNAWKSSTAHWALLMSKSYNYLGIGVAYRSSNRTTYASIVLTESVDQTRPWARMVSHSVKSAAVTWAWTGADTSLQTHTAGLKNFDVQYRVDNGSWTTIKAGTTATSLTLSSRPHGHWYSVRVMARDNRGLLSNWSLESRAWVP